MKFTRYIYQPGYQPISISGGGNIEISSISCMFQNTIDGYTSCEEFFRLEANSQLYRSKADSNDNYRYYTILENQDNKETYLTGYIRKNKIQNDFDGLTISVDFKPGLSAAEKEEYLKVADQVVLSIK